MGNVLSYCCKERSNEIEDEQEEQSRIWSENSNNCNQYGAFSPPDPVIIYKIVLPKLIPVEINISDTTTTPTNDDHKQTNSQDLTTSTSSSSGGDGDSLSRPSSQATATTTATNTNNSNPNQKQPAVIKEEYCQEQFDSLRSLILKNSDGQQQFRELLWSCIPWAAPGGKSGSTFLKTVNDQFILKEMSKLELQSFLSIADEYFNYVEASFKEDKPSLLSTIFGIYRIVYTNSNTNSSSEYYFMVMRNLFYKRNISQRFDLKGSMRNRLVDTKDPDNTESVLMDENLLRLTCEHPLMIHARSKQILNEAIDNDSKFLTSISVMDYSLLVGVDREKHELVLGIIDYVRPFTWDKRIERVVKSVVGHELPTIIEPELYRERFCEAMDKYFESAPDNW